MKVLAALALIILTAGCDSRSEMREHFQAGRAVILTDAQGNQYIALHGAGDNYELEPVLKK